MYLKRELAASKPNTGDTADYAHLKLQKFSTSPCLDFGEVSVGSSSKAVLRIENPLDVEQTIGLAKFPSDKGFHIHETGNAQECDQWIVPAGSELILEVTWTPESDGAMRELVYFLWETKNKLQVTFTGRAGYDRNPTAAKRTKVSAGSRPSTASSLKSSSFQLASTDSLLVKSAASVPLMDLSNTMDSSLPATAQRVRTASVLANDTKPAIKLGKRPSGSVSFKPFNPPKNSARTRARKIDDPPSPTFSVSSVSSIHSRTSSRSLRLLRSESADASKSIARKSFTFFHREVWMEKQERAYVAWLNHWLTPFTPDFEKVRAEQEQAGALASRRLVATMRGLIWKEYTQSPDVAEVMMKIEQRVDEGRLKLKDAETTLSDVRLADLSIRVLMNYHPFWLRLALEIVTGRSVLQTSGAAAPENLQAFIKTHFMNDEELQSSAKYSKPELMGDLARLVLKRFLLLVLLLDRTAMLPNLPTAVPLLFQVNSSIKTSSQVVLEFLQPRLQGEGNLLRHLELTGYKLSYQQDPLMEYPYSVKQLAVDLRDGLRMCRLAELLTGEAQLLKSARFPSDKRAIQVFNTDLALQAFKAAKVPLEVLTSKGHTLTRAEDIVDGDRELTLGLLWQIALHMQLPALAKPATLKVEVQRIAAKHRQNKRPGAAAKVDTLNVYFGEDYINLLMQWVQAVCTFYGMRVHNFTACFADGRALCYLICYYLPSYLAESQIYVPNLDEAAASHEPAEEEDGDTPFDQETKTHGGWAAVIEAGGHMPQEVIDVHKQVVMQNFSRLNSAARALGNIPEMLSGEDFSERGPDERAVILYTAFLCARLLEVSKEERAAHVIQCAWARYVMTKTGSARSHLSTWMKAAAVVQRAVRAWLFRKAFARLRVQQQGEVAAITRLQAAYRTKAARAIFKRCVAAAQKIQAAWREFAACKLEQQTHAAIVLQAYWRAAVARKEVSMALFLQHCLQKSRQLRQTRWTARADASALLIQSMWKGNRDRQSYHRMRQAITTIQASFRMIWCRRNFLQKRSAAILIQRTFRRYSEQRHAAVIVQCSWRGVQAQKLVQSRKQALRAAVTVQRYWRGYTARASLQQQNSAATAIQSQWRRYQAMEAFQQQRTAVIVLQSHTRRLIAGNRYQALKVATITIQAAFRSLKARQDLAQKRAECLAATMIQSVWRGYQVRQNLAAQAAAATAIAAYWKGYQARKSFQRQHQAATIIQQNIRRLLAQQQLCSIRIAAIQLQASWRGARARQQLQRLHQEAAAAVTIQSIWRSWKVRQKVELERTAAVCIQSHFRGFAVRNAQKKQVSAAVALQAAVRRYAACRRYAAVKSAALMMQCAWRGVRSQKSLQTLHKAHQAVTVIQSTWRGYKVRTALQQEKAAATTVQKEWRRHRQHNTYLTLRSAAILLQAHVRQYQQRSLYTKQRRAAVTIQALWRSATARQHLHHLQQRQQGAITIQAAWKGYQARKALSQQHAAAARIQASWRCMVATAAFGQKRQAVLIIQAAYRRQTCLREYHSIQAAALTLQAAVRSVMARRLLKQHQAAVCIQRHIRGQLARNHLVEQNMAATSIQSAWRSFMVHKQYQHQRLYVITIQKTWRRYIAQTKLRQLRAAAVHIQSSWRGYIVRKQIAQQQRCAVLIQSVWRAYYEQQNFQQTRQKVILCQSAVKGYLARTAFQQKRHSAIVIQSNWRRLQAQRLKTSHLAAICIQRWFRGSSVRQHVKQQTIAATLIQAHVRAYLQRRNYSRLLSRVILLQSLIRKHQAQHRFMAAREAAVTIQAAWRRHAAQMQLQTAKAAAIAIQAAWRCHQQLQKFQQARAASTCIQAAVRRCIAQRYFQQLRQAAIAVQACFRLRMAGKLLLQHQAAAKIQAWVRGAQARKQLQTSHLAAIAIQSQWRAFHAMQQFRTQRAASVLIQAMARRYQQRKRYLQVRAAAITVQRYWRGYAVRSQLAKQAAAATTLQACWRSHMQRHMYLKQQAAIVVIQKYSRGWIARNMYMETQGAIIRMQRAWRRKQVYLQSKRISAAVVIQAAVRCHQAQQLALKTRAALTCQRLLRGVRARQELEDRCRATIILQAAIRGWNARQELSSRKDMAAAAAELREMARYIYRRQVAAARIQAHWKGRKAREAFAPIWAEYCQLKQAALTIQSVYRGMQVRKCSSQKLQALHIIGEYALMMRDRCRYLTAAREVRVLRQKKDAEMKKYHDAAAVIQSAYRMFCACRAFKNTIRSAVKIQAAWKGYWVRKKDGQRKREARRKLEAANQKAMASPHKQLGVRCREALEILLASRNLTTALAAVDAVEQATRYSRACCSLIVENGGISALLRFVRSCNRSKPHVELLRRILNILNNVSRYKEVVPGVYASEDCINILSERLQFFRDTEEVFMPTLAVLRQMVCDPSIAAKIGTMATVMKLWDGIALLLSRKIEMERKYIARLEGQKGSDVTAREATKKMLCAAHQLEALQQLIAIVKASAAADADADVPTAPVPETPLQRKDPRLSTICTLPTASCATTPVTSVATWKPRNTLAREAYTEVKQTGRLPTTRTKTSRG